MDLRPEQAYTATTITTTAIDTDESAIPARPGALFHWLNPRDPQKARRRFAKLYWRAWKRLLMSAFLTLFGLTFVIIGISCMKLCDEFDRGIAFLFAGLLMFTPGMYGTLTLFWYLRCRRGISYKQLPDYGDY